MKLANSAFLRLAAIAAMIATLSAGALGCTAQTETQTTQQEAAPSAVPANTIPTTKHSEPEVSVRTIDVAVGDVLFVETAGKGPTFGPKLSTAGLTAADWATIQYAPANNGMLQRRCGNVPVPKGWIDQNASTDDRDAGVDGGATRRGSIPLPDANCPIARFIAARSGTLAVPSKGLEALTAELVGTKSGLATLGEQVGVLVGKVDQVTQASNATNARLDDLHRTALAAARADTDRWNKLIGSALILVMLGIIVYVTVSMRRKRNPVKSRDTAVTKEEITAIVNEAATNKWPTSKDLLREITDAANSAAERAVAKVRIHDYATHAAQAAALALKPVLEANTAALDAGRRREEALTAALNNANEAGKRVAALEERLVREDSIIKEERAELEKQQVDLALREGAFAAHQAAARDGIKSAIRTIAPQSGTDDAAVSAAAQTFNGIGPTAPLPAITEDDADDRTQVRAALPLTGADDADPPTLGAEGVASANTASEPAADHDGNGSNGTVHAIEDAATVDNTGSSEGTSHVRPANGHSGNGHAASRKVSRETLEVTIGVGTDGIGFVCLCCRRDLADDNACEEHKKLKHYQCLACHNAPIVVDFEPWMEHLKDFHPGSNGDQDNDVVVGGTSMPPPAANPSADYEGAVALAT